MRRQLLLQILEGLQGLGESIASEHGSLYLGFHCIPVHHEYDLETYVDDQICNDEFRVLNFCYFILFPYIRKAVK